LHEVSGEGSQRLAQGGGAMDAKVDHSTGTFGCWFCQILLADSRMRFSMMDSVERVGRTFGIGVSPTTIFQAIAATLVDRCPVVVDQAAHRVRNFSVRPRRRNFRPGLEVNEQRIALSGSTGVLDRAALIDPHVLNHWDLQRAAARVEEFESEGVEARVFAHAPVRAASASAVEFARMRRPPPASRWRLLAQYLMRNAFDPFTPAPHQKAALVQLEAALRAAGSPTIATQGPVTYARKGLYPFLDGGKTYAIQVIFHPNSKHPQTLTVQGYVNPSGNVTFYVGQNDPTGLWVTAPPEPITPDLVAAMITQAYARANLSLGPANPMDVANTLIQELDAAGFSGEAYHFGVSIGSPQIGNGGEAMTSIGFVNVNYSGLNQDYFFQLFIQSKGPQTPPTVEINVRYQIPFVGLISVTNREYGPYVGYTSANCPFILS
jgi:hypothetical protein